MLARVVTFLFVLASLTKVESLSMLAKKGTPKNIVVVGGGIQGVSVAYQIAKKTQDDASNTNIVVLEAVKPASAASGKGGGFMARSWGDGSPTQGLHQVAFDMYAELSKELGCESYRKLPVLSVSAGYKKGIETARKQYGTDIVPDWLDGKEYGRVSVMGYGDDTAQITPKEFVTKMLEDEKYGSERIKVVIGKCTGVQTDQGSERGNRKIVAVNYLSSHDSETTEEQTLPADVIVVSAGPWSCQAEDWFQDAVQLPMEGVKSTSIVWKKPVDETVDATALFCGEDGRYNTHLEVYPRPDGSIYICGIGGSDYISTEELKAGAFVQNCDANESRVQAAKQSFQQMSSIYKEKGELDRVQACMRPCPPDAKPYMGKIPGYEGAYINAGHNCWGIAWAPACGKAISELVIDGKSKTIDLSPFDPSRFTPSAKKKGRGRKKQGTSVGEQW